MCVCVCVCVCDTDACVVCVCVCVCVCACMRLYASSLKTAAFEQPFFIHVYVTWAAREDSQVAQVLFQLHV